MTTAVRLLSRSAPELILQLLEAGADPNARGEWGRTPLYWAVRRSVSAALVGALLEAGADPNAPMLNAVTPFEAVAASAKPEVIRLLAAAGADVNRRNPADGSFPLHRAVAGKEPASRVAALLDAGANPRVRNADGDTPLHLAAPGGDSTVISLLAGAGADWKARNDQGGTPLDAARRHGDRPAAPQPGGDAGSDSITGTGDPPCEPSSWHWYQASFESMRDCLAAFAQAGRPFPFQGTELRDLAETLERSSDGDAPEKIALLLAAGADPNGHRGDDPFDLGTPLHFVARGGLRAEVVASALVEAGADVNAREPSGWTPLHVAAAAAGWPGGRSIPMVRLLLQAGADVSARTYMGEEAPLHMAVKSRQAWYRPAGPVHVVAALLEAGADVDARTSDGRTPLELALMADQAAAAVKLLEAGADPAVRDRAGNPTDPAACGNWGTATFFAVAGVDAVAGCLEAGADPNSPPTLLHLASVHARDPSVIDILAQAGTDVGARDENGATPLHRAARVGTPDAVRALLRAGADPHAWEDRPSRTDGTPLHSAAYNPNPEVAAVLLEADADVNARSLAGWTPLHNAARNPNSAVLAVLLEAGADPTKRGRVGGCFGGDWSGYLTPLYSAAHGNPETVPMLVAAGADVDGHGTRFRLCRSSLTTHVSPIFYAVRYNGHPANIEALARAGADLELAGPDGRTVLHWAAIRSSHVFPLLLRLGADPEALDDEGKTPMDYARENPALPGGDDLSNGARICRAVADLRGPSRAGIPGPGVSLRRLSRNLPAGAEPQGSERKRRQQAARSAGRRRDGTGAWAAE